MGRAKLRIERILEIIPNKGYFPELDFEEIPDGGSRDLKHGFWFESKLRKFPGMDRINSSAASATRGNGAFFLDVEGAQERTVIFGAAFYEDASGTLTNRTGAITITDGADNLWQFINHQQGANKYMIGVNGTDAPFKWDGSGNAEVLAGSPPNFHSIAKYHDTVFGSDEENVYFSATGDPETWDTGEWVIPFEHTVTRVIDNGNKLACFFRKGTGSVQGYDILDFVAEEVEIRNVGCVGRLAATNVQFGKNFTKAIATVGEDGIWLIDESFGSQKLFGDRFFEDLNRANLHKSIVAYSHTDRLLYVALPKDDTENDYLIIIDMDTGAAWPGPDIHTNSIRSMATMNDDSGNPFVYFVDNNGYAFKFNKDTKNYHTGSATQAIDFRWKSKNYDLKDIYLMRGLIMLADAVGDYNVTVSVGFGLDLSDGDSGTITLESDGDLLGSTFILGASTLGGSGYVFNHLSGVYAFGRFMTIALENDVIDNEVSIKKIEVQGKRRRMGYSDK